MSAMRTMVYNHFNMPIACMLVWKSITHCQNATWLCIETTQFESADAFTAALVSISASQIDYELTVASRVSVDADGPKTP
jgi:hypothetical protein